MKILILAVLAVILFSLAKALFHMSKNKGDGTKVARALTMRIGLSVALFVVLVMAMMFGWIEPHGLNPAEGSD